MKWMYPKQTMNRNADAAVSIVKHKDDKHGKPQIGIIIRHNNFNAMANGDMRLVVSEPTLQGRVYFRPDPRGYKFTHKGNKSIAYASMVVDKGFRDMFVGDYDLCFDTVHQLYYISVWVKDR